MREVLKIINKYDPGYFIEDLKELGVDVSKILLLGSNENPYEPSEAVKKVYFESINSVRLYPDASYRELKKAIARYLNCEIENIAVGCGASELINCICMAVLDVLDRVVIPIPSYTMYAIYAMLRDAHIEFPYFRDYDVKGDVIAELKPKLTFVCSPNNPTGNTVKRKVIEEIAENSGYVVVDEAYVEFADSSNVDLALEYDNLIVLRSFSKFFGLAGLIAGYAIASKEIVEALEKIRLPFGISTVAAKAAIAAINSVEYYKKVRDKIIKERERLYMGLTKIDYLKPYPSKSNFILVKVLTEKNITEHLFKKGIIIRNVTSLLGLEGEHVRITVGKPEENNRLLEALKEV